MLTLNQPNTAPLTEDEARQLGFGQDSQPQPARIVSYDANYDLNLEGCRKTAEDTFGSDARATMQSYSELVNTLVQYRREVTDNVSKDLPEKGRAVVSGGELQLQLDVGRPGERAALLSVASRRIKPVLGWTRQLGIPVLPLSTAEDAAAQIARLLGAGLPRRRA